MHFILNMLIIIQLYFYNQLVNPNLLSYSIISHYLIVRLIAEVFVKVEFQRLHKYLVKWILCLLKASYCGKPTSE